MKCVVEVKNVTAVLLVGGWSDVDHASFEVHDSPVILQDGNGELDTIAGGREGRSAVSWITEGGERITCHVSEIRALRWSKEGRKWDPAQKA
jgi:hypothetical protein